jgi:hypothetical protein
VRRWDSPQSLDRLVRAATAAAVAGFVVAIAGWPGTAAVLGAVLGAAAVLCALFAWFRLDDLRGRRQE